VTASDTRAETWKPIPGFSAYQASDLGRIRSLDRKAGDRQLRGVVLKTRLNNRGYVLVNLTDDAGVKQTRTVHSLVLETFAGPCPDGCEALHANDVPADNRWPGNLRWGTPEENMADRARNSPAAPKPPPKPCVRCGGKVDKGGRRCHACVVEIGVEAAALLDEGVPLDEAAERLEYPSLAGLHTLARKYGGYAQQPPVRPPLSQRVMTALRSLARRGDAA
jgi:hypothetical protein